MLRTALATGNVLLTVQEDPEGFAVAMESQEAVSSTRLIEYRLFGVQVWDDEACDVSLHFTHVWRGDE